MSLCCSRLNAGEGRVVRRLKGTWTANVLNTRDSQAARIGIAMAITGDAPSNEDSDREPGRHAFPQHLGKVRGSYRRTEADNSKSTRMYRGTSGLQPVSTMCGILVCVHATDENTHHTNLDALLGDLRKACALRGPYTLLDLNMYQYRLVQGPDAQNDVRIRIDASDHSGRRLNVDMYASELQLRGDAPVVQPQVSEDGDVLCWNGEVGVH
jgi:hypothetical protein